MAPVLRSPSSMSMHLFPTPVECTHCGTVVGDPMVDRCPTCGDLLKERRTPARLAGVERRHGNIRFLLGILRFLAIAVLLVGGLVFVFSDASIPWTLRLLIGLGTLLLATGLLVVAALFDVALDLEENTRASFRVQQMVLEALEAMQPIKPTSPTE
jgi:predicted RNA-binding Zn-ribbon protein involved in translation (DUF1610 family)